MEDMNKRGFDGRKLRDAAKALIEKHGSAALAKPATKPATKPTKPVANKA